MFRLTPNRLHSFFAGALRRRFTPVLLALLCFWPALLMAREIPVVWCIGAGQEREIQNMMIPFRLGLEVADGFVLEQVVIESERIVVRLLRGEAESRLILLPPERPSRRQVTRFAARHEGDPAGRAATEQVAARMLSSSYDPWARCERSLTLAPSVSEELERRLRQPGMGILLVLASTGGLILGLSAFFHRRGLRLAGHATLFVAACLLGLLLAELILRLTLSGWARPVPLRDGCYPSNPRGYFNPVPVLEHPGLVAYCMGGGTQAWAECENPVPDPAPLRVVALGDSFTEATGVAFADTWPKRLEARLNASGGEPRVQVVNCGRAGANMDDIVARYRELAQRHDPQLVIYAFVLNDVGAPAGVNRRQMAEIGFQVERPEQQTGGLSPPLARLLGEQSAVGRLLLERLSTRWIARETEAGYRAMYAQPPSPELESALELTAAMAEDSRAKGRRFLVMLWPLIYRLDAYPFSQAHDLLAHELSGRGVPVLDLLPALRRYRTEDLWVHPTDYHPNEKAQQIAAETLEAALKKLGWLDATATNP